MWFAAITLYNLFAYFFHYLECLTCLFKQLLQVQPIYYSDLLLQCLALIHSATITHAAQFFSFKKFSDIKKREKSEALEYFVLKSITVH